MKRYCLPVDDLSVNVELKAMRSIRLRVKSDGVYVSAPYGTPSGILREFVHRNLGWIRKALIRLDERQASCGDSLSQEEINAFIIRCKPRFDYWQEVMGLYATNVSFKLLKSRWGSCNPLSRNISINVRLCRYPDECTDYIIVHELAHIAHQNHSAEFWTLVEKYIPHWRSLRKRLRGIS